MRHDYNHDGAWPWRGVKRDKWEGGHRVPLIVRWPGKVVTGSTSAQITSLCDVFATAAELVGSKVPENAFALETLLKQSIAAGRSRPLTLEKP